MFSKTVDNVIKNFSKVIEDLEKIASSRSEDVVYHRKSMQEAADEANKAESVSKKLKAIFEE